MPRMGAVFHLGSLSSLDTLNRLCCALKGDALRILESCRWTALESIVCQGSENEVLSLHILDSRLSLFSISQLS